MDRRREHSVAASPADPGLPGHSDRIRRRQGDYQALQAKIEKRYSDGLYLLNSFTWSKSTRQRLGPSRGSNGDNWRINYRNIEAEFSTSGYDQPLNNTTTVVWECPSARVAATAPTCPP